MSDFSAAAGADFRAMAWKEVAATIGWISESGVKAIYDRYITRGGPARMGRPPKKH